MCSQVFATSLIIFVRFLGLLFFEDVFHMRLRDDAECISSQAAVWVCTISLRWLCVSTRIVTTSRSCFERDGSISTHSPLTCRMVYTREQLASYVSGVTVDLVSLWILN